MKVGSLFSGIGGFDLGLERAGGFQTAWFCEQDPYCTKVLNKHWPDVPVYPGITELKGSDVEPVDVLCGGFPCQDLSFAGKGAGLAGARSGLWSEYARLIGELQPRYIVVENVSALLARGMGTVLGDLAALGYDTEWDCIPASAVGAPHRRDRVWLVAYPNGNDGRPRREGRLDPGSARQPVAVGPLQNVADAPRILGKRPFGTRGTGGQPEEPAGDRGEPSGRSVKPRLRGVADGVSEGLDAHWRHGEWDGVPRVAVGVENRTDRLRALGNALVPQIAEWIGGRIMEWENEWAVAA